MDRTTHRIIGKLLEEMVNRAETAMRYPKSEPFEHGTQVGVWQGLDLAQQIIESVLNDREEEENRL